MEKAYQNALRKAELAISRSHRNTFITVLHFNCESNLSPRLAREDFRGYVFNATRNKDGITADHANFGLAIFIRAQPRNICRHHHIIAAARFE